MRGSYNAFMMRQAIMSHPPVLKKRCDDCRHWDETEVAKEHADHKLCRQWGTFTEGATFCDHYTSKSTK